MSVQQIYANFAKKEAERLFWQMVASVFAVGCVVGYLLAQLF